MKTIEIAGATPRPATELPAERCGTCRYVFQTGQQMICRLKPPTLHMVPVPAGPGPGGLVDPRRPQQMMMVPQLMSLSPAVTPENWCGEYTSGVGQQ